MAIHWNESLRIGVADLDEQHREFFVLFNKLSEACQEGHGSTVIQDMLENLVEYTTQHFSCEEALLERLGHPNLAIQREQHFQFKQQISNLRNKFYQDASKRELAASTSGVLVRWLIQHIRKEDREIAKFVASIPSH